MANTRFRPTDLATANDGNSRFLGFVPVAIMDYQDKSENWDWADVYLDITLQIESSQYPVQMKVCGSYDKEASGEIKTCPLLKRVYWLADAVGFQGGPDKDGNWVDDEGEEIDDIASYLSNHHAANPLQPSFDYYAYVYKKQPGKDGKSYTEVYPRLVPNTDNGRKELEGYIGFLKSKNLIKEFDGEVPKNGTAPTANAGTPTQF